MTNASGVLQSWSPEDIAAALPYLTSEERAELDLLIQPDYKVEWARCQNDAAYFIANYCHIFDKVLGRWVLFSLWPVQIDGLSEVQAGGWFAILKRRQIGETWLILSLILWLCIFRPVQQWYLFSIGLTEAKDLTGFRLRGMTERLPDWMRGTIDALAQSTTFANGSRVISLPGGSGRSYAATGIFVDEADYNPDLDSLLAAAEPAVEGAGWMILLSTSDKSKPTSRFKQLFRASQSGLSRYKPLFYGYGTHPNDTDEQYAQRAATVMAETGSMDQMHGEYPRNPEEAMAPLELSARLPSSWVNQCFQTAERILIGSPAALVGTLDAMPDFPGLVVWRMPEAGKKYVLGVDPSEGQPGSHESPIHVLNAETCEEVAVYPGPAPMHVLGSYIAKLAQWYNRAGVLIERNNHGHAVLLWLSTQSPTTYVMSGPDGRPGWLEGASQKMLLYDLAAKKLRESECVIHDQGTKSQLCSIEANTLKAPEGMPDDRAMSFVIALTAADCLPRGHWGFL